MSHEQVLDGLIDMIAEAVARKLQRKEADPVMLSTAEAAKLMRTSPAYVRQLITTGELPSVRRGRVLRLMKSDVVDLLERKRA